MQRKWFVLLAGLVLLSLMIAPVGMAGAQVETQASATDCPPFDPALVRDKGFMQSLPPECAEAYQKLTLISNNQADKQDISSLAVVGGPDFYGYTWDDSVAFSWIDATGGTDTGMSYQSDGQGTGSIPLPFPFKFYENTYNSLYIAASGYLGFTNYGNWPWQGQIPSARTPNNVIAPWWTPLNLQSAGPTGRVYYNNGGSASDRYFVAEWYQVTYSGEIYTYEVILYENSDIVFQYQTMTVEQTCGSSGIEDSTGLDGLAYLDFCNMPLTGTAVRFSRPDPTARVQLTSTPLGNFTRPGATESFKIDVRNAGDLGADTFDLTSVSSWPVSFYAADGTTPLTDTDSDGTIDTGSVAQGATTTITVKVITPGGATVGNANSAVITAVSSLNTGKSSTATLSSAVPAPFAQIYRDDSNGAMSLYLVRPNAQVVKKATANATAYGYNRNDMAMAATPNGNFVYLWTKNRNAASGAYVSEIEYALLDHYGNTVQAVSNLTDNSEAAMETYDYSPSVAVAPNGTIGVAWYHQLNNASSEFNYNIYFATLDASGNLLSGPTNVTNNTIWGTYSDPNIPRFISPTIAASDDNRFILSWDKNINNPCCADNIWYATYDTAGVSVFSPAALTSDNSSWGPILNSLTGGKAILTFTGNTTSAWGVPSYAVLASSGTITKPVTSLAATYINETADAVLLPNGNVALAWVTNTGVQFDILNSSYYALVSIPTSADSPSLASGQDLSVTTDSFSRVIMTWQNGNTGRNLFYALGDSDGAFTTAPMSFKQTNTSINTSYNGQGNLPYNSAPVITSNGGGATASQSVAENTTAVTTVTATDADGNTLTYSISGGVDAASFSINASTGVLTFISAPNFENPIDSGANNTYEVIVQVSDGTLSDTQTITVTVTDVNEAPVITSNGGGVTASQSVAENTTAVTTVTATDADGGTLTYSISGGADAAFFSINASTGVLTFISAPNFENPADSGANNTYEVIVQVSDGTLTDTQTITVTVTDVTEIFRLFLPLIKR